MTKHIRLIFLIALAALLLVIFSSALIKEKNFNNALDVAIFEKRSSWGPCSGGNTCYEKFTLRKSGKITIEGNRNIKTRVSENVVKAVLNKMEETNIFHKECLAEDVLDYSATYTLSSGPIVRTLRFPACQEELTELEKIISQQSGLSL